MSLANCLPELLKQGAINPTQAKRMRELYEELEGQYRTRMAAPAAAAAASEKTLTRIAYENRFRRYQKMLQSNAQLRIEREMTSFAGGGHDKWRSAALAILDHDWKERATYSNVEARRRAILGQSHAMMTDVLERHHRGFLTGAVRNKADLADLEREAFGEASGNEAAKQLAEAWDATAEWLRQRANAAGADIGKLKNWGFPQSHNSTAVRQVADGLPAYRELETRLAQAREAGDQGEQRRVGAAMVDMASAEWRGYVTPRLDRMRMIDNRTGEAFTAEALDAALDKVFRTIRTDGWEGRQLGAMGGKKLADNLGEERFLIFRDAQAAGEYRARFGDGDSFGAMMHHLERMSRDIAHMEILGPDPGQQVRWMNDLVESKRQLTPDSEPTGQRADGAIVSIDQLFASTSGALSAPVNPILAKRMGSVRGLLVAGQLGSAAISAVPTDIGWSTLARIYRGMPLMQSTLEFARLFRAADRHDAIASGFIAEEASRMLHAGNRFVANEQIGRKSGWLAERVMNLSLIAPWTQNAKWTFGRGLTATLGKFTDRPLEQVPERFQRMLRQYGISGEQWEQIRATPLRDGVFLEPTDVNNAQLRDRLLEMALTEVDAAIPSVTATARASLTFGQNAGSLGGEAIRSIGQYKSFGVSLVQIQAGRLMAQKGAGNKLLYLAGMNAIATSAGFMVLWLRDIRSGQDPRPISPATMGQAWLAGTGFGVFGDYLTAVTSERAGDWAAAVAGPTVGALGEFGTATIGTAAKTAGWANDPKLHHDGTYYSWNEQTQAGRRGVNLLKRYAPGTNIWYARRGAEALLWDQLQYLFDPDPEKSWKTAERNHAKEGHADWWHHGELTPFRAPDMDVTRPMPKHDDPIVY